MVDECEAVVTELLRAIAWLNVQLAERHSEVMITGNVSDVGSAVHIVEYNWKDEQQRQVAISAELHGEVRGVGSLCWLLNAGRDGTMWAVEREVVINHDGGGEVPLFAMPVVELGDSRTLAASLASLFAELLAWMPGSASPTPSS